MCPETFQRVGDIVRAEKIESVSIRGVDRKTDIYRVKGLTENTH